jgi:hypothetical protein
MNSVTESNLKKQDFVVADLSLADCRMLNIR